MATAYFTFLLKINPGTMFRRDEAISSKKTTKSQSTFDCCKLNASNLSTTFEKCTVVACRFRNLQVVVIGFHVYSLVEVIPGYSIFEQMYPI